MKMKSSGGGAQSNWLICADTLALDILSLKSTPDRRERCEIE